MRGKDIRSWTIIFAAVLVVIANLILIFGCKSPVQPPPPPPPPVQPPPPPPPEPPGIARVTLVTDKGVVFTGKALPGERLVAQVIDSAGHVVTDVILTANASPGWTVRGDTVIAPSTEGFGTVSITATRLDPSSATSDPATLASTIDLSKFSITAAGVTCRVDTAKYMDEAGGNIAHYQGPNVPGQSYGHFIDSAVVSGIVVDSLHYAGSGDWRLTNGGWDLAGIVYWHATTVTYYTFYPADSSYAQSNLVNFVKIYRQVPDTLVLGDSLIPAPGARGGTLQAPSYTVGGIPFCGGFLGPADHQRTPSTVTLEAR